MSTTSANTCAVSQPRHGNAHPASWSERRRAFAQNCAVAFVLAGMILAVYYPVAGFDFVNYDDPDFVTKNSALQSGFSLTGLGWALTMQPPHNWYPLTWWSLLLDYQLYGLAPGGYHVTNLLWHIASTLMLYVALRRLTGAVWSSAAVAALFAVHPLNVEPVAWVSERKGVVSTFFAFFTLWAYGRYAERPTWGRYALVSAGLALGLMAKQMLVTMPCLLLLLDYWPLRRWQQEARPLRLVYEKLPLLALSIGASVMAMIAQANEGAVRSMDETAFAARAQNAAVSYVAYLTKGLMPTNLTVYYPHPGSLPVEAVIAAVAVLSAITAGIVALRKSRPELAVGWFWYLGTLVPVIGLVQLGSQARADRYAYVPLVGIFIAIVFSVRCLAKTGLARRAAAASLCLVLLTFMVIACRQLGVWRNSILLWEHAVAAASASAVGHNNLGAALEHVNLDEAMRHYREARRLDPNHEESRLNLAQYHKDRGEWAEASTLLSEAVGLNPDRASSHYNLAVCLLNQGEVTPAVFHFHEVLRLERGPDGTRIPPPEVAMVYFHLGLCALRNGDLDVAAAHFAETLHWDPQITEARQNLGLIALQQRQLGRATALLREVAERDPSCASYRLNLGTALVEQGDLSGAAESFAAAARLDPGLAEAHLNLGIVRVLQGKGADAVDSLRRAVARQQDRANSHSELAHALTQVGLNTEAAAEYKEALRLDPGLPHALCRAAWPLATDPEQDRRHVLKALHLAQQAVEATDRRDVHALDTLAAAYAEAGLFAAAVSSARNALAESRGDASLARAIEERLRGYEQGRPYRQTR
jgi:protein O-mannosyl-transferase